MGSPLTVNPMFRFQSRKEREPYIKSLEDRGYKTHLWMEPSWDGKFMFYCVEGYVPNKKNKESHS